MVTLTELYFQGRLIALPSNIRDLLKVWSFAANQHVFYAAIVSLNGDSGCIATKENYFYMLLALGELSDLQFMRGFTLFKFIIGGLDFELKRFRANAFERRSR